MSKVNRKVKVLAHFFVPYAVLLAGFVAVGLYAYGRTAALVENQTNETAYAIMAQTKETLDRRFEEIETISEQVAGSTKARSFPYVGDPFAGTNPARILELQKGLFDYPLFNHFILDYYIVYPDIDLAVSPHKVYTLRQFYDLKFQYDGFSFERWRSELSDRYRYRTFMPGQSAVYDGKRQSVVSYLQSFGTKDRAALVLMLIDNSQIQSMLRKLVPGSGGFAFITDDRGQAISGTGGFASIAWAADLPDGFSSVVIDGRRMLVTRTTSQINGWTYVSAQPESVVLHKVHYFEQLILTIIALGVTLGLIAAALFAYRNSRPLWLLLRALPAQHANGTNGKPRSTWDDVRTSVAGLVYRNNSLEEKLEQQAPLIRSGFYERLLRGQFASDKDIVLAMEHSRLQWEGDYFAVAVLAISGYDGTYNEEMLTELEIRKMAVRDVVDQAYGGSMSAHDLGENQVALVLNGDAPTSAAFLSECLNKLKELRARLAGTLNIAAYAAVGGCYSRLTEISRSYEEARLLLQRTTWTEARPVVCRDDDAPPLPAYYYPPDVEQRLINLVKSGDVEETGALLELIRKSNLEGSGMPAGVGRILLGEMSGTLLKCIEQTQPDDRLGSEELDRALAAAESGRSAKDAFKELADAFLQMSRNMNDRKKSHNTRLKEELIRHLDEHYMQTDLSLSKLAERFGISEAYVSYFFKEQTGVNFSDYLENERMKHAKRLLEESDMPVNEVAARVGYYSLNTFGRAFKRANGLSATEYRKMRKPRAPGGF
ncbi:helix-turn-helix domain-containing protein [Cohnella massiliensis]|uniref:helix-turn-helix domain-containing protein n=1 Tax=Cohnella massiliensis TaxID=1816691 RepID=UPI001594A12F|nr:helix-turn-helix domain-containing protein [Cohnella massiliensis]